MNAKRTGRGPQISKEVRQLIISQAIHDSKTMPRRALAVRLQELIERMGEVSPTEDTLMKLISKARNKQPSELEKPWSIGACFYYNIPSDIISILIKLRRMKEGDYWNIHTNDTLTIREARWVALIYPAAEPWIRDSTRGEESMMLCLDLIASAYSIRERASEQINEPHPNTLDLDKLYFDHEEFLGQEAVISWWQTIPEEYQHAALDALKEQMVGTVDAISQIVGRPLSPEEVGIVNSCFEIVKRDGVIALQEFVNQSPIAQKMCVFDFITETLFSNVLHGGER